MTAKNFVSPTAFVEPDVELGHSIRIGPGAVLLRETQATRPQTKVGDFVEIGANATIRPGVIIGRSAQVMPGVVVTRPVPPLAIIDGSPCRVIGYRSTTPGSGQTEHSSLDDSIHATSVGRVAIHRLKLITDPRGNLVPGEFESHLPFFPKRFFLVFDVPSLETRGEHAHIRCEQFLIAVRGSVCVVVDNGTNREELILDRPDTGIYLPPMIWGTQYKYSHDCVLLVFASHNYDAGDYIRTYDEFLDRCCPIGRTKHPLEKETQVLATNIAP